jgi:hypothetical protein
VKLSSSNCTGLKTKFNAYASFHISVNEEDFPSANNIGVSPNGCLIAAFFGRSSPEQIYSPEASTISETIKQPGDVALASSCVTASGEFQPLIVLKPCVFCIFYQNVRGLRTMCNDFIDNVFANNFKTYCITETWLNDSILSHNLFPDSYFVLCADRDYNF